MTTNTIPSLSVSTPSLDGGEPRWFLGHLVVFKASGTTTEGRFAVVEQVGPLGGGTPLHTHHRDDEWFYVLEGELTVWVGGRTTKAGPGTFVHCPRDVPHTSMITSPTGARFLVGFAPAVADGFIRACSEPAAALTLPPADLPAPTEARLDAAAVEYGIELLGPPGIPD